jgi:CzcA family heavy metal efflux pump
MWIVQVALRKPYTFIALALLLLIGGGTIIARTPTDIFPNIEIPVLSVIWTYNGLSAEEMGRRITGPYERAITTDVDDIEHIESQSLNGVSVIKIFFHQGADINRAIAEAAANAQSLLKIMPPGTLPPMVMSYNASTVPILSLALSSKELPEQTLYDLGNNVMRTQLATVQGAGVPIPYGGKVRQVMVDLDMRALQQKRMSPLDVVNAINAQNLTLPGGTAKIGGYEYTVNLNGSTQTVDQLNDIPVQSGPNGVIYIRDVAHVRDGYAPQTNIVRHDGERATLMEISKRGSASTLDIIARVKDMLPRIKQMLPASLNIETVSDQSIFVQGAIDGVVREGVIAAGLTAMMILFFLGSWESTLIIAVSIPLAVIASLATLSILGETINIMTLGGLALAVGILVDDATVAIENITHHLEQGKPLIEAILDGSGEIALPTLVSTLSICIVFVPMLLLSGVAHFLFTPLALAVVFAMIASYLLSRTLVPTLAMYLLRRVNHAAPANPGRFKRAQQRFEAGLARVRHYYAGLLTALLHRPRSVMLAFCCACLLSLALFPLLGEDFFPQVDTGQIKLHVRARAGTRIEQTAALADQVENTIRMVIPPNELETIVDNIGLPTSGINLTYSSSAPIGASDADILVTLKPEHRKTANYVATLRATLGDRYPGVTFAFLPADIVSQILNFGLPAPIDIQVVGQHLAQNREFAAQLMDQLRGVRGLVDLRVQQPGDAPGIDVEVDRTKALQAGMQQRDIASNLLIALSGSSQTAPNFWLNPQNGVSYPVTTEMPQYSVDSLQALSNLPLTSNASAAAAPPRNVILGTFGSLSRNMQQAVVSHYNVQPLIDIYGSVQGRDLGAVAADVNRIIERSKAQLPKGASIVVRGQVQTMQSSFTGLFFGIAMAIGLVYILMVINFQSWVDPLIILGGLPAALAGVLWILFITNTHLSVPALTGAMMCIGIATANSILVISFAREKLKAGAEPLRAALEAGIGRFRPVLMTALAMLIGMVPMALGLGDGGEQNAPLGLSVIGGLAAATLATLLIVPVLFSLVHQRLGKHETTH